MTDGTSHLHIDRTSAESPHAQLQRQLADGVADGTLRPGTRLPPVRTLATELGLAPNTVAKVIRELEQAGVLETRGRQGTFVALAEHRREAHAREAARAFVDAAKQAGLTVEAAQLMLARAWSTPPTSP